MSGRSPGGVSISCLRFGADGKNIKEVCLGRGRNEKKLRVGSVSGLGRRMVNQIEEE